MIRPPESSEYKPYYGTYISLVRGDDLTALLASQLAGSLELLRGIPEPRSLHRYAAGKWSIKDVLGHITDAERIFACRALRFARNDPKPLPGFDQDPYVEAADSDSRPWSELIAEFELVRRSTILLFRGFTPEASMRSGIASDAPVSVRALGYIIAGHELHHMGILREKYLN